uniref:Otopetrin 2 n=1 Tax=Nothobranchius furzeri TaxID=105023 RepID=A0A1A8B8K2_NOTFU
MCINPVDPCECWTSGGLCEPCTATTKDREMAEVQLSNHTNAAGSTTEDKTTVSSQAVGETGRSWGWMLSGVICLNILMLGCSLVSSGSSGKTTISFPDLQLFLVVLLLFSSAWMMYYSIHTAKTENAVVFRDEHAGPVWLRGGLLLFGMLSIIMDIFKIASYVGFLHCDSAVQVAFPVVQLVFVLVQTYFLWIHSKDCVQRQKSISRCGLMLTLSTNLVLWMTEVAEESLHQTTVPDFPSNTTKLFGRSWYISRAGYGDESCTCSHTSCSVFKEAYYYLYPFNIEYCLFASAMVYVMWKNVGRVNPEFSHHIKFNLRGVFVGPAVGAVTVVAGLATFIIYEIEISASDQDEEGKVNAVMMYFIVNIVITSMMSVCTIIGSAIFKVDHRDHVKERNPTRSLDVGLLVGSSLGQFVISYFSIIAMIATGAEGHLNRLNLAWGLLMVIQLGLQNFFIVEGLHREPYRHAEPDTVVVNPYVTETSKGVSNLEMAEPEKAARRGGTAAPPLLWKRRVLREVCAFLLLCNIILWIMPAFGARPQFDHDTETLFYQFSMWAAVVNMGLPFGIFYRMHAVASLFEVFLKS